MSIKQFAIYCTFVLDVIVVSFRKVQAIDMC